MSYILLTALLISRAFSATTWGYVDFGHNVSHWVDLYPECGYSHQSPIDITINDETSNCNAPLLLEWESETEHFVIRNNGHSLQATPFEISHEGGSDLSGLEVIHHTNDTIHRLTNLFYNTYQSPVHSEYCFDSLHFHWADNNESGSEHTINGEQYPLEVHFVHYACDFVLAGDALSAYSSGDQSERYDDDNVLAVIGVLFEIGEANPVLDAILNDIIVDGVYEYHDPESLYDHKLELFYTEFNMMDLLPSNKEFVGYKGSLTTPPCYETVRWHVMKNTMTVSLEQMQQFRSLLGSTNVNDTISPNFRPVQDIGDRVIYECQETVDIETVEKEELAINNNDGTESESEDITWFIIGIVFICLFGISVLFIGFLSYIICTTEPNDDEAGGIKVKEKKRSYESTKSNEIESVQLQNDDNYH